MNALQQVTYLWCSGCGHSDA